jgi:N12 class adenine-specific DNA methylase
MRSWDEVLGGEQKTEEPATEAPAAPAAPAAPRTPGPSWLPDPREHSGKFAEYRPNTGDTQVFYSDGSRWMRLKPGEQAPPPVQPSGQREAPAAPAARPAARSAGVRAWDEVFPAPQGPPKPPEPSTLSRVQGVAKGVVTAASQGLDVLRGAITGPQAKGKAADLEAEIAPTGKPAIAPPEELTAAGAPQPGMKRLTPEELAAMPTTTGPGPEATVARGLPGSPWNMTHLEEEAVAARQQAEGRRTPEYMIEASVTSGLSPIERELRAYGRAAIHGVRTYAVGATARAIGNLIDRYTGDITPEAPIQEIDPNSAVQRLISMAAGLGLDGPTIMKSAGTVAAKGMQKLIGAMAEKLVEKGVAAGLKMPEAVDLSRHFLTENPAVKALVGAAVGAAALGTETAVKETATEVAEGKPLQLGKIAGKTGLSATVGALTFGAAAPVEQPILRYLAQVAGFGTVPPIVEEGRMPTVQDYIEAGVAIGLVEAAAGVSAAARMARSRAQRGVETEWQVPPNQYVGPDIWQKVYNVFRSKGMEEAEAARQTDAFIDYSTQRIEREAAQERAARAAGEPRPEPPESPAEQPRPAEEAVVESARPAAEAPAEVSPAGPLAPTAAAAGPVVRTWDEVVESPESKAPAKPTAPIAAPAPPGVEAPVQAAGESGAPSAPAAVSPAGEARPTPAPAPETPSKGLTDEIAVGDRITAQRDDGTQITGTVASPQEGDAVVLSTPEGPQLVPVQWITEHQPQFPVGTEVTGRTGIPDKPEVTGTVVKVTRAGPIVRTDTGGHYLIQPEAVTPAVAAPPKPPAAAEEAPKAAQPAPSEGEAGPPAPAPPTEAPAPRERPVTGTEVTGKIGGAKTFVFPDQAHKDLANLPRLVEKAVAEGNPAKGERLKGLVAASLDVKPEDVMQIATDYATELQATENKIGPGKHGFEGYFAAPRYIPTARGFLHGPTERRPRPTAPAVPRGTPPAAGEPKSPPSEPKPAPAGPKPAPGGTGLKRLDDAAAAELRAKLRARLGRPQQMAIGEPGPDPTLLRDLRAYGGHLHAGGVTNYEQWATEMVRDLGDEVQEYLEPTWDLIQASIEEEGGEAGGQGRGEGPLEAVSPANVPGPQAAGQVGKEPGPGPGPDGGGALAEPEGGDAVQPGVGLGEGPVVLAAEREGGPAPAPAEPAPPEPAPIVHSGALAGADYTITADERIGGGTPGQKYADNVAAITLLKQLEQEGRVATPEEQGVLARYIGWGQLATSFDRYRDRKRYDELKQLLTDEEFSEARGSTVDAYHTSIPVVRSMWEAVRRLGFQGGKVLESSAGIGNFKGAMPPDLSAASGFTMVEKDPLAGRMLKALYPRANVSIGGFEATYFPDNYFDLGIGNVPFGGPIADTTPSGRKYGKAGLTQQIHDYFFAKMLDKVRPGGILALITSSGTLDKVNPRVRTWLAERAELVAAFRLPSSAFKANAGTEVTTDLIILKKRPQEVSRQIAESEPWVQTTPAAVAGKNYFYPEGGGARTNIHQLPLNNYYHALPSHMIGELAVDELQARPRMALKPREGEDFIAALNTLIATLPPNVMTPVDVSHIQAPTPNELLPLANDQKPGAYVDKEGHIWRVTPKDDALVLVKAELTPDQAKRVRGMLKIRDVARDVLRIQRQGATDEEVQAAQANLSKAYDAYVGRNGFLHEKNNVRAMMGDPDAWFVLGLEQWNAKAKPPATKADIFTKRTIAHEARPTTAANASDAMDISLNETNKIDWRRMTELTGKNQADLIAELGNRIFKNPEGTWEPAEEYLSGNVRAKLRAAEAAVKMSKLPTSLAEPGVYERNVEALKAVQPEDLPPSRIKAIFAAPWIPVEDYGQFIADILEVNRARVQIAFNEELSRWMVQVGGASYYSGFAATNTWGTNRINAVKLLEMTLNLKLAVVKDKLEDGSTMVNEADTAAAQEKQRAIKERFKEWVWEDGARAKRLSTDFNERFNNSVPLKIDGTYLKMPGTPPTLKLRAHQKDDIARGLRGGNLLITRLVGSGKTWTLTGLAMEAKRLGLAKKGVIVVPNHLTQQWGRDVLSMYPNANVLVASPQDLGKARRNEFMTRIATGNWDIVIAPRFGFAMLPMSPAAYQSFMEAKLDALRVFLEQEKIREGAKSRSVKQIEKAIDSLEAKMKERIAKMKKDNTIFFEELGIDLLIADEAHDYKNLYMPTQHRRIAGISSAESDRAFDMFMKTQYLTKLNGGRGVVFATGTPISNTMGEAYVMLSYLAPQYLAELGMTQFDSWANTFGNIEERPEFAPEGQYRVRRRFANFVNVHGLGEMWDKVATEQGTNESLGIAVPKVAGGGPKKIMAAMSDEQIQIVQALQEAVKGGVKAHGPALMLMVTNIGRKNSIDPRLVKPDEKLPLNLPFNPQELPEHATSKANVTAKLAAEIHQRTAAQRSTIMIFLDIATPKERAKPKGKVKQPWEQTLDEFMTARDLPEAMREQAEAAQLGEILGALAEGERVSPAVIASLSPDSQEAIRAAQRSQESGADEGTVVQEGEEVEDADEIRNREAVYGSIKRKLIALGVPESDIAFIHDAKTPTQKQELFDAMNRGDIRILFGSRPKMGVGTNAHKKLIAIIHVDVPWRPDQIEQADGRGIRNGNENEEVEIYHIIAEGGEGVASFDSFMWQLQTAKATFVRQFMNGQRMDEMEDLGELVPSEQEFMAAATNNPAIIEKVNTEQELLRLTRLKKADDDARRKAKMDLTFMPEALERQRAKVASLKEDIASYEATKDQPVKLVVDGVEHTGREAVDQALKQIQDRFSQETITGPESQGNFSPIGMYRSFALEGWSSQIAGQRHSTFFRLKGAGDRGLNVLTTAGIEASLRGLSTHLLTEQRELEKNEKEIAQRQAAVSQPFQYAGRMEELQIKLGQLNAALGIGQPTVVRGGPREAEDDTEGEGGIEQMMVGTGGGGGISRRATPPGAPPTTPGAPPTTTTGAEPTRKDILIRAMTEAMRRANAGALTLQGGFHGPAGLHGQRDPVSGNIRLRKITDIDTFAHEAGHGLQRALKITFNDLLAFKAEMNALVAIQRVKGPKMSEGFAEFVRLYTTDPTLARATAPSFYPWFEARLSTVPDLEAALHELRDGILALRSAPPTERVRAGIAFEEPGPTLRERVGAIPEQLREERRRIEAVYFDRAFALRELASKLDPEGADLAAQDDPGKMYSVLSAEIYAHGTAFLKHGIVDYTTGTVVPGSKAFNDIVRPVAAHQQDYIIYEILARIQAFERSTVPRYQDAAKNLRALFDLRGPQLDQVVQDLERQYPHFPQVLAELQEWNQGLRQYVVDAGRVSQESLDALQLAIDTYVPLFRLMEKRGEPRVARTVMNTPDPFKRLGGKSQRIVLPTLQERAIQAYMMVGSALRNEVFLTLKRALTGSLAQQRGVLTGTYMDKVAIPLRVTQAMLEEFRNEIETAFKDAAMLAGQNPQVAKVIIDALDLQQIVSLFRPNLQNLPKDYFMGWEDGKVEVWQVHDPLMRLALQGLDRNTMGSVGTSIGWAAATAMKLAARGLRTAIVHSPDFLVAHLTRETQEAMLQGYLLPPIFRSRLSPEMMQRYRMAGGQLFRFITLDRATIQRNLDDLKYGHWYEGGVRRSVRELAHFLGEMARPFDELTRKGVFRYHVERPRAADIARGQRSVDIEAAYQAREAGIDFETEGGSPTLAFWESITAFMKPSKLGFYRNINNQRKAWQEMRRGNWSNRYVKGFLIFGAAMFAAEMLSYFLFGKDPRYRALPDDQKNTYFVGLPPWAQRFTQDEWDAMTPEEQLAHSKAWIKIPKPYMPGWMFATFPRQMLEFLETHDPAMFKKMFQSFVQSSRIEAIPTFARGAIESYFNYDMFRGRAIESRSLEDLPVPQRYYEGTPELYRAIAKQLPESVAMSPVKMQHLVNAYFSYMGQYTADAADYLVRALEGKEKPSKPEYTLAEQYVIRRFAQSFPGYRVQAVDDFYKLYHEVNLTHAGIRKARKEGEPEAEENPAVRGVMVAAARQLSANRKAQQLVMKDPTMDPKAKREQMNLLLLAELNEASRALRTVEALRAEEQTAR